MAARCLLIRTTMGTVCLQLVVRQSLRNHADNKFTNQFGLSQSRHITWMAYISKMIQTHQTLIFMNVPMKKTHFISQSEVFTFCDKTHLSKCRVVLSFQSFAKTSLQNDWCVCRASLHFWDSQRHVGFWLA